MNIHIYYVRYTWSAHVYYTYFFTYAALFYVAVEKWKRKQRKVHLTKLRVN